MSAIEKCMSVEKKLPSAAEKHVPGTEKPMRDIQKCVAAAKKLVWASEKGVLAGEIGL